MGCGGSKFDANGEAVSFKVRPLMHRRISEINRRRNNGNGLKGSTPSKKELLHDEDDDNDSSGIHSLNEDSCKKVASRDSVEVIDLQDDLKLGKEEKEIWGREKTEEKKRVSDSEEDDDGEDDDDDGDGDGDYDEDVYICPASPSFRVYYVESLADENDDDHDDCKNLETIKELSQGDERNTSTNSTEGSVVKNRKKGNTGRRIKRVIHKAGGGGHAAVKNLMNVRACYNPAAACSHGGHSHARLVQKSSA